MSGYCKCSSLQCAIVIFPDLIHLPFYNLRNNVTIILVKSSLTPHSLAFNSHNYFFLMNDCIAKKYTKIACNISSDRYGVRLREIQPFFKFL